MNALDKLINYFNPKAGLERAKTRAAADAVRAYDIASKSRRNAKWRLSSATAAQEVGAAFQTGAAAAQELVRNNPLAKRAKRVIASRTIGLGVKAEVISDNKKISAKKTSRIQAAWDEWAESTDCDFEGTYNLYGLQYLWVSTLVESGGVFVRRHINPKNTIPLQLQTFEQSHLDTSKQSTAADIEIIDGVQFNNGKLAGYWLFERPAIASFNTESRFYKVEEIVHIFLKERAGQHVGMTWFDSSANTLRNYDVYADAKLMQQQIAALFALIIEDAPTNSGLGLSDGSRGMPDELEPAMIEYVQSGQNIHTITPPKADNATEFDVSLKQLIASGIGVTYEQLTGDYSRVSWASGRMGNVEFYAQLDIIQGVILQPSFNKIFDWFLSLYNLSNATRDKFKADWTFPPHVSVEPSAEFDLIIKKVRNGMLSPRKAAKALGENLPLVLQQWEQDKALFGDLPFDCDPSMFSSAGNQLDVNTAAAAGAGSESEQQEKATTKQTEEMENERK